MKAAARRGYHWRADATPCRMTQSRVGDHRAAVFAAFLGWTLDAFDFFLVVFALTAIARDFGTTDAAIALTITVTLAFRPIGALLFGPLADRYGRRLPLMLNLVYLRGRGPLGASTTECNTRSSMSGSRRP